MIRICSPQLGINPKSVLGGEVCDREILMGLAKQGVAIEILLPKGKPHDKGITNWKITYVIISHAPAFFYNFIFLPYLFIVYFKSKFKLLRIHIPPYIGIGALIFKFFLPNMKLLAYYHNFYETQFGFLSRYINNSWDYIITDSKNVRDKIIDKYGFSPDRIYVAYNGISGYIKPSPKDEDLILKYNLKEKKVLLSVGLFIKRKNPLFLLDVLKRIVDIDNDVVLIYLGKGPLKNDIIKKAKKLNIWENIRIIDPIFGEDKNKIFNLADIFLHPSYEEGFAVSVVEAMGCSKPVVISDDYSAAEAVENGVNGYLCKVNDIQEWFLKTKKLLEDKQLSVRFGKESLKKVKNNFTWNKCIEMHLKVLKRIENEIS